MGGLTSLSIAQSGMWAAQGGLSVVGHNLANVDTDGYSRQSIIQRDWKYLNVRGGQLGFGTDISTVRQIRNNFLDIKYRNEVTKATYYSAKVDAGKQIESLLGELQSEYTTESVIHDVWNSLNELVSDPSALETRGNFISSAITLVDKMQVVYDGLIEYQQNLNESVKDQVSDINYYVSEIDRLTRLIKSNEVSGANANDYRDARNNAMDALSEICNVDYKFKRDDSIDISIEGRSLLSNGMINKVGLRYTVPGCSYVEPVFTESTKILNWNDKAFPLYDLTTPVDSTKDQDGGLLKGTLMARGISPADYTTLNSLISPKKFIEDGAPDPKDYRDATYNDGYANPAYIADAQAYLATLQTELDDLITQKGTIIAPDSSTYTDGVNDPQYLADYEVYKSQIMDINKQISDKSNYVSKYSEMADNYVDYKFNYDRMYINCTESNVPVLMQNLDTLFHDIVTMINDAVAPIDHNSATAPTGLDEDNTQFMEIFTRNNNTYGSRYDSGDVYMIEDPSIKGSLYSISNVTINSELLNPSGYNKIAFSSFENPSDPTIVNGIIEKWSSNVCTLPQPGDVTYEPLTINEAYNFLVTLNATETQADESFLNAQVVMVNSVESNRLAVMGVSLDEEMANMTVYQNAYEASARIFSVIDQMIDRLINGTGRVGL